MPKKCPLPNDTNTFIELPVASLRSLMTPGAYFPYPTNLPPIVNRQHQVLMGRAHLWEYHADHLLKVRVLQIGEEQAQALCTFDIQSKPLPSHRAYAAAALRGTGLSLRTIQTILQITDIASTSRWVRLVREVPHEVLQAVDDGVINFGHTRYLVGHPIERITQTLAECRRKRMTIDKIRTFDPEVDRVKQRDKSDIKRELSQNEIYANEIGEVLGARVRIVWPDKEVRRKLIIDWYGVDTLRGILKRISEGTSTDRLDETRREIAIPIRDADELEALVGHLKRP